MSRRWAEPMLLAIWAVKFIFGSTQWRSYDLAVKGRNLDKFRRNLGMLCWQVFWQTPLKFGCFPPFIRRIKGSLFVHEFVYFSTISNFRSRYDKIRAKLAGCSKADNQPGHKSQIINHRKILRKYSTIKDYISLTVQI